MTAIGATGRSVELAAFVKAASQVVAMALSSPPAGFHLIVDTEHGAFSDADLETICGVARLNGPGATIRVPSVDPIAVGRAFDRGATGVMLPRVRDVDEVSAAAAGTRLAPQGTRGWDPMTAATAYGSTRAPERQRLFVQIETIEALQAAPAIANVTGVTDLFIGPADLSRVLGATEPFGREVLSAMADLPKRVSGPEVRLGSFVDSPARARWASDLGYRFLAIGSDVGFLRQATTTWAADLDDARIPARP